MTAFFTLFYYTLNKSFIDFLKGKIPLTIYLDMIFLLNLFCNWMILLLTKLLVRTDTKWYRILLGSIFASLLVPLTLYFPHSIFTSVLVKLLYFILILFCNLMILLLTKLLVRTDTKWYRILLGSIFASLLVPLTLYFPHSIFTSVLGKLVYSILIVWCTFGFHSLHNLGRNLFVFYFVSFAIGGGLFGIHFILQYSILDTAIFYPKNVYGNEISFLFIIIVFPLISLFINFRMFRHV